MKPRPTHTRATATSNSFELSHPGILGDALEQNRIQLEQNLNHLDADFSYRASSQGDFVENHGRGRRGTKGGFEFDDDASIEYPRHREHSQHGDSFIHSGRGDVWSYGAYADADEDDYDGINPYGGETMSTAAHHASALTLTTGLGGGRGQRRNTGDMSQISLSGAEYDPDRPLDHLLRSRDPNSGLSIFDLDPSRSKYSAPGPGSGFDIDPLVVDSTAELDKILESGYAPHPSAGFRPSSPSASSASSSSDSEGKERHRITDSLRRVSFSPKRPRVATPRTNSARHGPSPLARQASLPPEEMPTPKARQISATSTTKRYSTLADPNPTPTTQQAHVQPQVRLQPPTPSNSTSSKPFNIGDGDRDRDRDVAARRYNQSTADSLYTNGDLSNDASSVGYAPGTRSSAGTGTPAPKRGTTARSSALHHTPKISSSTHRRDVSHAHNPSFSASHNISTNSNGKLHLPDVTGLTSAVESPARPALRGGTGLKQNYLYPYKGSSEPREVEVRLLTLMNTIQDKLSHLEDENGISRRRVRELEWELEECKREVVKERTRVEQAIFSAKAQTGKASEREQELERALADAKKKAAKGKARATREARDGSMSINNGNGEGMHAMDASVRYKEVIEEKKALESLITTLRSHLTRLTSELSSHQELLHQLFALRESDLSDIRKLKSDTAALNSLRDDLENIKLGARAESAETLEGRAEEIERLRVEVERLGGEVEVLRGVVEEGLRERRMKAKDRSKTSSSNRSVDSNDSDSAQAEASRFDGTRPSEQGDLGDEEIHGEEAEDHEERDTDEEDEEEEEEEGEEPEPFDPMSIPGSSRASNIIDQDKERTLPNQTIRTDHATLGTLGTSRAPTPKLNSDSPVPGSTSTRSLYMDDDELKRIMNDVEERRSKSELELSGAEKSHFDSRFLHPSASISQSSPVINAPRPEAPTPSRHAHRSKAKDAEEPEPFPQIRGERLEKLFFSARDHDEQTCTTCRRHRGGGREDDLAEYPRFKGNGRDALSHHHQHHPRGDDDREEDEGFGEGSDEASDLDTKKRLEKRLGKQRDPGLSILGPSRYRDGRNGGYRRGGEGKDSYEKRKNLPQQTILARVIRELEDDFTHYKSVYIELADQYKDMDPVSDVRRRNLLARHLKEVVDILEQKGDQIASLYDLLTFKDKPDIGRPASEPQIHHQPSTQAAAQALRAAGMKRHPTFA